MESPRQTPNRRCSRACPLREPPGGASVFEGTFVRALRSLDELILHLTEAARTLGDTALSARLEACSAAVHRGLPFLNSLYF